MYALVIVPLPLPALTYKIPVGLSLKPGDAVAVPLKRKKLVGIVLSLQDAVEEMNYEVKEIDSLSQEFPSLSITYLPWLVWIAEYYRYPLGEVLRTILPPNPAPPLIPSYYLSDIGRQALQEGTWKVRGNNQKELIEVLQSSVNPIALNTEMRRVAKSAIAKNYIHSVLIPDEAMPAISQHLQHQAGPSLNQEQSEALQAIRTAINSNSFKPFLLQGVTGSGKTEVYLHAAKATLEQGRSVLVIVPEIALTPQLVSRFQSRLKEPIAILHSGLTDKERSQQWHLLNRGKLRVCIGARSASLAPMENLGLIVVDEEHDGALKQEDHLRYHGRDISLVRAQRNKCTIILGSATPSLESFHNARAGRFHHILLSQRANGQELPTVKIIDQTKTRGDQLLTLPLLTAITGALSEKRQVMLLLNRRGFSSFLLCESCGHVPDCPNCSVSLTNYQSNHTMKCHYCDYKTVLPRECPQCHAPLQPGTQGTEALEEEVKNTFPHAAVLRIDRESMEKKGSLTSALEKISAGLVDIIIGTQMIAKGHDFPNVSLVGVVNADSAFHIPDFRATERSFQLFTQMAGRAGRGTSPGKVYIQTFNPEHPSIRFAVSHDYRGFAEQELQIRHQFQYPPFVRMARVLVQAPSSLMAEKAALTLAQLISKHLVSFQGLELIGPAPAVLSKIQNKFRWNFLLKSHDTAQLHRALEYLEKSFSFLDSKVIAQVDVDPYSLM